MIEGAGRTRSTDFEEEMEKQRLPEQGIIVILKKVMLNSSF